MTYDQFDQFDAYTENALPDDKRRAFEQQLANDATLRAELADYHQFRHSIESVALKQKLEQVHARLDQQGELPARPLPAPSVRPRRLRPVWIIGILTVLVLAGLGLYWKTRSTPAERAFLAYYQPEPVARGMNDCGPELAAGLRAYRAHNYPEALIAFDKLPLSKSCVWYYRGLTQLALTNTQAAITDLQQAVAQRTAVADLTSQKAEWYLALAYLKDNRPDDARRQLRMIAGQPGHPFQQVAKRALTDVDHAQ